MNLQGFSGHAGPWPSTSSKASCTLSPQREPHAPKFSVFLPGESHGQRSLVGYSPVQFSHSALSKSLQPPWTAARQASLSITNSQSLPKFMSIELVMSSNLILCRPLLLLPSIFPSIRVFLKVGTLVLFLILGGMLSVFHH